MILFTFMVMVFLGLALAFFCLLTGPKFLTMQEILFIIYIILFIIFIFTFC